MEVISKGTFDWSIDRFQERQSEKKESSKFQVWSDICYLYIAARDGICLPYYTLYLENICKSTTGDGRTLKLCLIGHNGEEISVIKRTLFQTFPDNSLLLMTIRRTELSLNANDLLPGGTLTVRLSWYEEREEKRPMAMLENLSKDWSCFYKSKTNSDCVLKVGNAEFLVHRAVLCARSEVLAAMFSHDTSENRSGIVSILDMEADVIGDFLHFIYSGKVHGLTASTAVPLFIVADKYGVIELKDLCLSFLTYNLTVENVCDAATLAHTYAEEGLEKKVVQFIRDGMENVQGTVEWKTFSTNKPSLAIKLLSSVIACKDTNKETS